jgi:Poly(R)-hydroxyalkanoic acid synthase subunit (PHA_synth_III_E)
MTPFNPAPGALSVYNFWLNLIPQFMSQFAGGAQRDQGSRNPAPWASGLIFPADEIAKAAQMTQQSLSAIVQSFAPMLAGGVTPNLFGHWASALPAATAPSMQSIGQAWSDLGTRFGIPTSGEVNMAFERTYGALRDAFGLGPARELQQAWQELLRAGVAQQEARASYAIVVQGAFAQGYARLVQQLANKGAAGERIESVLALFKLWAMTTEEAVHETLQSERGLAATASLTRSALTYHKAVQKVAAILANMLDLATRRDLDQAFREIQTLKRELRASRRAANRK